MIRSYRNKLLLPLVAGYLVFIVLFHYLIAGDYLRFQQRETKNHRDTVLVLLRQQAGVMLREGRPDLLQQLLQREDGATPGRIRALVVYDPEGKQVYPHGKVDRQSLAFLREYPIMSQGALLGSVYVDLGLDGSLAKSRQFVAHTEMNLLLIITLLLAALMLWLNGSIRRPIVGLIAATRELASGNYTRPVPVTGGGEEVSKLARAFESMRRDIRRAHDGLVEARDLAAENEIKQRSVVENIVDAVIVMNEDGVIESCNPSILHILGYRVEEVVGQNITMLMPEAMRCERRRALAAYVSGEGEAASIGSHIEVTGRHKDGRWIPIDHAVREMHIGGTRKFTAVLRDISTFKQTEQQLIVARDEAERASMAKSEFLSRMSHELRTPLNAILGFAQILELDADDLRADHRSGVAEIRRAGQHLLMLVNDVLDLARVEAGKLEMTLHTVALAELVQETVVMTGPLQEERQVTVNNELGDGDWYVIADRLRLKQVVINLLSNAIKYNHRSGSVTISAERRGDALLRLLIHDTGPGISSGQIAALFRPFERLGMERRHPDGVGIGLTIAKKFIVEMQGDIGVASRPGAGSTFWIDIPAAAGAAQHVVA